MFYRTLTFLALSQEVKSCSTDGKSNSGDGDFGKVIGKGGKNISALRSLVFAINAKKRGKRAKLDVIDKNDG